MTEEDAETVTARDDGPVDDHVCRFDFSPGWVDLTLSEVTKAAANALATETVDHLNPVGLEIAKKALLDDMAERAFDLNEDEPVLAGAYYSDDGVGLANLTVNSYGDEGVPRPAPEEVQPLLLQWGNAQVASEK